MPGTDAGDDAWINGFDSLWPLPLIFGGIGLVFAGIGAAVAAVTRKRFAGTRPAGPGAGWSAGWLRGGVRSGPDSYVSEVS